LVGNTGADTEVAFKSWTAKTQWRRISKEQRKKEGIFKFDLEFIEFCPKSTKFVWNQGINRQFCGYPPKPPYAEPLALFGAGFKKLTGKEQGTSTAVTIFSAAEWEFKKYLQHSGAMGEEPASDVG